MTSRYKEVAAVLIVAAITMLLASLYVQEKQSDYRAALEIKLAEQETTMARMAELLDKDSADTVVNQIVKDCSIEKRERFDLLLGSLSQLSRTELNEIDSLFASCASYYADRKQVLTARFNRELQIRDEYLELLALTDIVPSSVEERQNQWKELLEIEKQRTQASSDLVVIQGDIIVLLREGKTPSSDEIKERLSAAQTTKDAIVVFDIKADEIREALVNI